MRCVCRQTQEQRMHCVCCRWLVPKCTAAAAAEATFVVCTASGSSSHSTRHYHHPHSRGSGFEMCNANVCFASCDDCGFYSAAAVVVVATYTSTPTRLCGPCSASSSDDMFNQQKGFQNQLGICWASSPLLCSEQIVSKQPQQQRQGG